MGPRISWTSVISNAVTAMTMSGRHCPGALRRRQAFELSTYHLMESSQLF